MKKRKTVFSKKRFPVLFVVLGVFVVGAVFGGSGVSLISNIGKSTQKEIYYSPEVFYPPKSMKTGATLGTSSISYHIPILLYHYVEYNKDPKDTIRTGLTIRRNIFERQVSDLLKAGYTFLTVGDVGRIIDKKMPMPEKAVVFSFDDGYRDFYTDILPILQFYNVRASFFIVSDFLNHSNNVTDEQMKEIIDSGLVEIGGHTVNHASLISLPKERAYSEIADDKKYLEDKFGIKMTSFAYPYGQFNQETIDLVKEAGYLQAVSVVLGEEQSESNKFYLFRVRPGEAVGKSLEGLLERK